MNKLRQLETFARAGWFARGVVYTLLGYLAIATGSRNEGAVGVLQHVREMPAGKTLLVLLAIGLAFYGAYRLYGAGMDSEGHGHDPKGIAVRVGHSASGAAHFFLAWVALKILSGKASASGDTEESAARVILDLPLGGTLLGAVGLAFLAAAFHQVKKAWGAKFMASISPQAPNWVKPVGQAGIAARAAVFAIIGYSLIRAGWLANANEAKGLDGALSALRGEPLVYALVALGLFMFGIFSFVEARWRRIRNEDVVARLKAAAR